jgi:hypothetical protein
MEEDANISRNLFTLQFTRMLQVLQQYEGGIATENASLESAASKDCQ